MKTEITYHNYKITYYLFPGQNLTKYELLDLHQNILDMNIESGRNFKYGIFDHDKTFIFKKEFYDSIILATIHDLQGKNCGFFYNILIPTSENKNLIHQGLVVIYNNSGVDLLKAPYLYSNVLMYEHLKEDYFISNISAVPLIIGTVSDIFDNVWPSIFSQDCRFPPVQYKEISSFLIKNYVSKYFPEGTIFDKKRFVLKSPLKEMGFGSNLKDLPRHSNWQHNLFSDHWLDLTQGEDIVQIGLMSRRRYDEFINYLQNIKFGAISNIFINKSTIEKGEQNEPNV